MFIFFLCILLCALLLVPAMLLTMGLLWKKQAPKNIWGCGYRTRRSLKSAAAWDFAHRYIARIYLYLSLPLAVVSVAGLLLFANQNDGVPVKVFCIILVVQMAALLVPYIPTERALERKFDAFGVRK